MDFDTVIKKRRSVRAFKEKKVSWKDMLEAVDSALQGPWADNICHLKFLIIEEPSAISKIASLTDQSWIQDATGMIVVCSKDARLEKMHGERGRVYGKQQTGAAINTLVLKLVNDGLAACWIGSFDNHLVKQTLSIPEDVEVEALIPIGYEDTKHPKNKRTTRKRALDTVLFWEQWGQSSRPALFREDKKRPEHEGFGH